MKKALLMGLTFGLVLSGCNDEESLGNGKGVGVRFTSYMVESRATDTAWEAGDEIGVYMQNAASASGFQKINVQYKNSADNVNAFTSQSPIEYSGNESTVNFMAVYPFSASVTSGNYTFTLGNESLSKNDIMYASSASVAAGTENVTLEFTHKLTKIVLQLNDENGSPVTGATISIDKQRVNGTMDMATGTVTSTDNYTSTLNFAESNEKGTYEAIVLPDEGYAGRSVLITTSDNKKYSYPVGDIAFTGATKYTFPVSLRPAEPGEEEGEGGETIIKLEAVTFNIDDWTEGKTIGWIISTDATISTENKTKTELATNLSLTTGSFQTVTPKSGMTLAATDVYCIEYTRTDAELTAATLVISQPNAARSRATQTTYTLPAGLQNGRLLFAVGDYTNGFKVSSTVALTLNAVSVYSASGSSTEEPVTPPVVGEDEIEIWTGSQNLGNWDHGTNVTFTEDQIAKATVGSTLRFYYSEKGENPQLQFPGVEGGAVVDVTGETGYMDMEVTADMLAKIAEAGNSPWLNGANVTVTKITLIPADSEDSGETETPVQTEEIEVWSGSQNLGNWNNGTSIEFKKDVLAKTTVGGTLRFYYTGWAEGAQLKWGNMGDEDIINVTDDTGHVDMPITEKVMAEITSAGNWPYVNGANLTVTKITLIPAAN